MKIVVEGRLYSKICSGTAKALSNSCWNQITYISLCSSPFPRTSQVGLNSSLTKLHESTEAKKSLIQPVKYRAMETGLYKMPHFETGVFKTGITIVSGQWPTALLSWHNFTPNDNKID